MDKYGVASYYRVAFARLQQHRWESTYEYFERFRGYLDDYPNHALQLHELLRYFLNGMRMKEQYILDTMAGGSIMDRTPTEVWYLIQDRAAVTRPYTECSKLSQEEGAYHSAYQQVDQFWHAEIAKDMTELDENMAEIDKKLEEYDEDLCEGKSEPEPIQFFVYDEEATLPVYDEEVTYPVYDEEVTLLIEKREDDDTVNEELQVIPSNEDVPTKEEISPQCSDIINEQSMVITCNPIILPTSNLLLSSHVQIGAIQKALCNNKVRGSLEKVTIHIPMVRNHMRMQTSEQFLDCLCINWKTRKKDMRGSLEKIDTHTHMACATRQTLRMEKLPEGFHRAWKRRKKRKHIFLDNECSMFYVYMQKSRSTFGWKPGWSSWRNAPHKVTKESRQFLTVKGNSFNQRNCPNLGVRKFDGIYPWAPNIW